MSPLGGVFCPFIPDYRLPADSDFAVSYTRRTLRAEMDAKLVALRLDMESE